MFFFQRNSSPLFFIFNVNIKIKSKERLGLFVVVVYFHFSLKVRAVTWFTTETSGCLKCKISPQVTWKGGRTDGWADDYVTTKIYWMHRQPNFLTHGTPRNARESSAITNLLDSRQWNEAGWVRGSKMFVSPFQPIKFNTTEFRQWLPGAGFLMHSPSICLDFYSTDYLSIKLAKCAWLKTLC